MKKVEVLEVRRRFLAINDRSSPWEEHDIDVVVWREGAAVDVRLVKDRFVSGLMSGFIDDQRVTLADFANALHRQGLTLADVERDIAAVEARRT